MGQEGIASEQECFGPEYKTRIILEDLPSQEGEPGIDPVQSPYRYFIPTPLPMLEIRRPSAMRYIDNIRSEEYMQQEESKIGWIQELFAGGTIRLLQTRAYKAEAQYATVSREQHSLLLAHEALQKHFDIVQLAHDASMGDHEKLMKVLAGHKESIDLLTTQRDQARNVNAGLVAKEKDFVASRDTYEGLITSYTREAAEVFNSLAIAADPDNTMELHHSMLLITELVRQRDEARSNAFDQPRGPKGRFLSPTSYPAATDPAGMENG